MRKIKFRAWEREGNRMVDVDIESMDGGLMPVGNWDDTIMPFNPEECEIMQFTGLYDRNGKEIFEGDILKIQYIRSDGKEKNYIGSVGYHFCQFQEETEYYPLAGLMSEMVEIIGNRFENPELLEGK